MSNFNVFSKKHLELLLDPFAPGMADHITPIKYEVLTPDCFLFLFRTTAKNGEYHYFVSLETDFEDTIDGARCTIEDWHSAGVIELWPLQKKKNQEIAEEDIKNYQAYTEGPYLAMLAKVKRPTNKGYWAESFVIMPGDNIGEKIKDFPEKVQANIRKTLSSVLEHKVDPSSSFVDSLNAKKQDTMKGDINQTDMAVSLYVQPDGGVELFYNYVKK